MTEDELAALIEGGWDGSEAREAKEHVAGCRACMAAYADAVHLRAQWHESSSAAPPNVVDARTRFRPRGLTWVLAASVSLLVAAGAWFLLSGSEVDLAELDPAFGQVASALSAASHQGMILPGCANAEWNPPELVYRSGASVPGLDDALGVLRDLPPEEYPESVRYLGVAGEIAGGNLHRAEVLLRHESPAETVDPNILLLAGILAYMNYDLVGSEKYLTRALDLQPGFPEARFNLALVMIADGRKDEARKILTELATMEKYPLLHHRAMSELANC